MALQTSQKTRFPLFNPNLLVNTVIRLMPLRHLDKVRGTLNQVNGLFLIADGMKAGTSPMITIREAFRVELGIQAWKGAIALHVFDPAWSACSVTRDQIMNVISRAHGPVMAIFQFSRRRRNVAEVGFFAAVEKTRGGLRLRRAPVVLPRMMSRALPCSSLTSTFNNNSDIHQNVQSCDDDNKGSSVGISYASGGNTTKGLIPQGVQRQGRKTQELPMPQRLKSQGLMSQEGGKSKGPGPRESGDDTLKEIAVYEVKSYGHNSRGQLTPEGRKPPEFSQASSSDNSGGIKFPGLKFQEVDSQEFLQSQAGSDYPKGCNSQECSQESGGVSSDSSGFKSLALARVPGGSNAKGIIFQGCSRDNHQLECNVRGKSNACFVAVSDEKEGALCFSNIKMALPRAMTLILLCLQKICMLISIKVNNAAVMVRHFLRNICKPIGNLLNKGGTVTHATEEKEEENTGVKTTLSERAPINTEDVQSEQNEVINEGNGEQQDPEKDGSVQDAAAFRTQLADHLDSKSCTVTHYMCVKEGLKMKLPTTVQDDLPDPSASSCILACRADSCMASSLQNDQGNSTTKDKRNEEDNEEDYLGGFNPQGIKPMEFTQAPDGNGPSAELYAGLYQAQGGSNFREIKFPSLNGGNCEVEDDVCGTSKLYSVNITDDKRALCLSRFKMAWLRAITLMLHLTQDSSMPNSNVLNKAGAVALSVEREEVQKAGVKKTLSEKGPINTKDVHAEQRDAVDTSLKGKEKDLKNHDIDGSMAGGPQFYQGNSEPKKEIDKKSEINTFDESDDDGEYESEPVVDHLEIEDEDQLDMVLEDGKDLPHDGFIIENPAPVINLLPYNPLEHIPPLDQVPDAQNILPAWLLANVQAQAQAPPAQPQVPNEEVPVNANLAQGHHENPLDDDDEDVDDEAEGPVNCVVNDQVPGDVAFASSCILSCQADSCMASSLQNDQTTKVKSDGTKESQDNFAVLSTFYERNEEHNEVDYLRGVNPQGIKPMEFTQAPDGDGQSEEMSTGLHQAQGGSNVREIKFPSLNGGNCEVEDDVCSTSKLYSVIVTDDKRALCLSSFKMAWLRAITIILHLSQNSAMPDSNVLNKAGELALSVESVEVEKAGVKKTLSERDPLNTKHIQSEQSDAVYSSVKRKEKDLKNHGIDGSMASGPQHYQGNSMPNKEIGETKGIQDRLDGLAVFVDSDDDEDYESEPVVDHLEIEDEDQLDMVLEDGQDLPHDGFNIENPAPVINLPPYNPLEHIPPLDQVPDAHNIFPAWLLAYQAHLANVQDQAQAQAQPPPAQPPGPNEEAPVNANPAQGNHENPFDDDNEEVDDEAEQPENGGDFDNAPGDVAAEPLLPPPPVPPPQQPHPNGLRNRLLSVARYLKKKLTRSHHHHVHPMYYPGAPWEEHPALGLDEAPAFPGGLLLIQPEAEDGEEEEERRPRWFSRCFGFLYRHQSNAVQEYPLQGDEAPEFEEAVEVFEAQEQIHDEIVEEGEIAEQIDEDEEPPQALQEFQEPIAVF